MSENSVAVYINPGRSIRLGQSVRPAVGKGGLNIDYCMAEVGNQNRHLTETAVEIQLRGFRKLLAAAKIQRQITEADLSPSAGQVRHGDAAGACTKGSGAAKRVGFCIKIVLHTGKGIVSSAEGPTSVKKYVEKDIQTEKCQTGPERNPPVHIRNTGLRYQIEDADAAKTDAGHPKQREPAKQKAETKGENTAGKGNIQERAAVTGVCKCLWIGKKRIHKRYKSRQKQP